MNDYSKLVAIFRTASSKKPYGMKYLSNDFQKIRCNGEILLHILFLIFFCLRTVKYVTNNEIVLTVWETGERRKSSPREEKLSSSIGKPSHKVKKRALETRINVTFLSCFLISVTLND